MAYQAWHKNNQADYEETVETIAEAITWLDQVAQDDLDDNTVVWNAQGLQEYDTEDNEWVEWYDDDGDDIRSYGKFGNKVIS